MRENGTQAKCPVPLWRLASRHQVSAVKYLPNNAISTSSVRTDQCPRFWCLQVTPHADAYAMTVISYTWSSHEAGQFVWARKLCLRESLPQHLYASLCTLLHADTQSRPLWTKSLELHGRPGSHCKSIPCRLINVRLSNTLGAEFTIEANGKTFTSALSLPALTSTQQQVKRELAARLPPGSALHHAYMTQRQHLAITRVASTQGPLVDAQGISVPLPIKMRHLVRDNMQTQAHVQQMLQSLTPDSGATIKVYEGSIKVPRPGLKDLEELPTLDVNISSATNDHGCVIRAIISIAAQDSRALELRSHVVDAAGRPQREIKTGLPELRPKQDMVHPSIRADHAVLVAISRPVSLADQPPAVAAAQCLSDFAQQLYSALVAGIASSVTDMERQVMLDSLLTDSRLLAVELQQARPASDGRIELIFEDPSIAQGWLDAGTVRVTSQQHGVTIFTVSGRSHVGFEHSVRLGIHGSHAAGSDHVLNMCLREMAAAGTVFTQHAMARASGNKPLQFGDISTWHNGVPLTLERALDVPAKEIWRTPAGTQLSLIPMVHLGRLMARFGSVEILLPLDSNFSLYRVISGVQLLLDGSSLGDI